MDRRIREITAKNILISLADLSLPRVCPVCGRKLHLGETGLCLGCLCDLPETFYFGMEKNPMADKFNGRIEELRDDSSPFEPYAGATSLFFYLSDSPYSHITQDIKYNRNIPLGKHFGGMLGRKMSESPLWTDVDAIIPVPLHWTRKLRRGYNQAEVISRAAATQMKDARVFPGVLRRVRRTKTQTALSYEDKRRNVAGAFGVNAKAVAEMMGSIQKSCPHIVIMDDVFTTGATMSECHRALRLALGPKVRISAATLACWK